MTTLENILSHFKDLAYFALEHGHANNELKGILEDIERGRLSANFIAEEHAGEMEKESIYIGWAIEDVLYQAESDGEELTDDEARQVLKYIKNTHDSCEGINWGVISDAITEIKKKNMITQNKRLS